MIEARPFASLGSANHGWLAARHHFSFASYHNPARMQWGRLRVWNDDIIQPATGFPPHPHANMEIITYVREGAITHEDSLGNRGRTQAGDVQVMSAGTGIRHSEYNREAVETHIFQIWLLPDQQGLEPSWDSRPFPRNQRDGALQVLASGLPEDTDALPIRSNARVLGASLKAGMKASYRFGSASRLGYLVPATGRLSINGILINARDGAAIRDEAELHITALEDSELVLVDTV